ncbi:MAG TPA: HNH endonuclease [Candidatus Corynebacterium faecigallinarum]|uniref:HNH endonuclease n=1 Tax=Candidatus Corynebacterium faecigallinarum TaxID=2838528 RepID=A0A9D2QBA9_9CORY|nr:HNH endonuclease [Candidatus Corynebacterium faecigallinarum]
MTVDVGTGSLSAVLNTTAGELSGHLNRGEMALTLVLADQPEDVRCSLAESSRGRGRAEAVRFAHAADMVLRIPETFICVAQSGRFSVAHLDMIYVRIQRHMRSVASAMRNEVRTVLDAAVDAALSSWLSEGAAEGAVVHLKVVQDLVDAVFAEVATDIAEATERREADSAELTRSGTSLRLNCGSETIATATWDAITQRALEMHTELSDAAEKVGLDLDPAEAAADGTIEVSAATAVVPTLGECRARVLLDLLGDTAETMKVQVNLFRLSTDGKTGVGPGYVIGQGWVSEGTAAMLETAATKTVVLEDVDEVLRAESEQYRFPFVTQLQMEGRDGFCRFPGCDVPACRCDHDHIVASSHTDPGSDGPTSLANGMCLCRRHHVLKTRGIWRPVTEDGGLTVEWTGPDGEKVIARASGPLAQVMRREMESSDPDPPDTSDPPDMPGSSEPDG